MKTSFAALLSATALVGSSFASPVLVERQSFPTSSIFDDGNSAVKFDEGGWTHLTNQGQQWRNGTESYTDNPSGAYRVDWPYVTEGLGQTFGLKIYSGRKNDRGDFAVALTNGTELGTGNAYADVSEPTSTQVVFEADNLYIEGPAQLVVRNRPKDKTPRVSSTFITLDYIEFTYNAP